MTTAEKGYVGEIIKDYAGENEEEIKNFPFFPENKILRFSLSVWFPRCLKTVNHLVN